MLLFTALFLACRWSVAPPVQQTIEMNGGISPVIPSRSAAASQPSKPSPSVRRCIAERDQPTAKTAGALISRPTTGSVIYTT